LQKYQGTFAIASVCMILWTVRWLTSISRAKASASHRPGPMMQCKTRKWRLSRSHCRARRSASVLSFVLDFFFFAII
jgi:hypothetical protein